MPKNQGKMSIKLRHHLPAFFDVELPSNFTFETIDELREHLREWELKKGFHRWSLSENRLMAEYDSGKQWYVVGYVSEPIDLPQWIPPETSKDSKNDS